MSAVEESAAHISSDVYHAEDSNRTELLHDQARESWDRFKQSKQREDLDQCIALNRETLALRPIGHPDRLKSVGNLAVTVLTRFKQDGQREDLDELIAFTWEVIGLISVDHPHRSTYISNLATALGSRFKQDRQQEDLNDSITLNREALELRPIGDRLRSRSLSNLADVVMTRFKQDGEREDLDEFIMLTWEVIALLPVDDPHHFVAINDLAMALKTRFEKGGQREDLDDSITLNREALALCPTGHPDRLMSLSNLALAVESRFNHDSQQEDLVEFIKLSLESLTFHPVGHPNRPQSRCWCHDLYLRICADIFTCLTDMETTYMGMPLEQQILLAGLARASTGVHQVKGSRNAVLLHNQAVELSKLFMQSGNKEDLEDLITLNREALARFPVGHSNRFSSLNNLAAAVWTRFEQDRQRDDLDKCITFNREALALLPAGNPDRSSTLNNLAAAVMTRFEQDRQQEDLDESITFHRDALALRPADHPDRYSSLINLAIAVMTRFQQVGQREDLDQCITFTREALALSPADQHCHSHSLITLAVALKTRFEQNGQREDLDESITFNREALALRPAGHPDRSSALNNLAAAVITRFEQDGQREDLDECITFNREALALLPAGNPNRSCTLNNLAAAIKTRFKQDGQREDLDESITFNREALALRPAGHPDRSNALNNLAAAVMTRFKQDGQREDLNESITFNREALASLPAGNPDRSSILNNLAGAVMTRFEQDGQREDLDESITFNREALALCPAGHPDRSSALNNLAIAVMTRFKQDGQREDLNESITFNREALALLPAGNPNRSGTLNNLANDVMTRFEQDGQREDLNESITFNREALALRPAGNPDRSCTLNNLANAVMTRFKQNHQLEDLNESMELRESAALHTFSSLSMRLDVAVSWADFARSQGHHTTLKAYETALDLLQRALTISPTLQRQHGLLAGKSKYAALALNAASYAIEKGDFRKAIELLEQGRGLLWSHMRGLRTPLDKLSEIDKPLADRFRETSNQLEALALMSKAQFSTFDSVGHSAAVPSEGSALDAMLLTKRQLSEKLDTLTHEIQKLPGFSDFLRLTPFETLRQAANEGPVIIINHSRYGSDCLIILKDTEPVCIHLSESFSIDAIDQFQELFTARILALGREKYDNALRSSMEWLWETIIRHVVEKLNELGIEKQSRIWLCPTSILTFLPIHAAGPYEDGDGYFIYFLDDYVVSYTSTLKALIDARANIEHVISGNSQKPSLLVIGQPGKGVNLLPNVPVEVNVVRKHASVCLENEQTTKEVVLRRLRNSNWVHFACHGHLNQEDPFSSFFELLNDERLTLLNIVENNLPNAELAFLSACHSAALSFGSALEEVLHLAAAMQFCGFRSVIGTMWELCDLDGPVISEAFYEEMVRSENGENNEQGSKKSARALREATLDLRGKDVSLERWVNFIHIGA